MPYNYSQYQPNGGYQWNPSYYPTAVNAQQYSGAGMQTAVPMNQMQQPQQLQQNNQPAGNQGFVWVQGEAGAKAYPVAAGNSVLLMDSESPVLYMKSTDISGRPLPIETYDLVKREEKPVIPQAPVQQVQQPQIDMSQYVTMSELEAKVEELVNKALEK